MYSIIYITSCPGWRSSVWAGPENQVAKNFRFPKKVNKDSLKASHQDQRYRKHLKIGTVFEYHVYEILKFSLNQIQNGFETLSIGT